jgi:hypothetical protein
LLFFQLLHNEEGIKEVKKEGFRSITVPCLPAGRVYPTLFITRPNVLFGTGGDAQLFCLPLKALLFFVSLILMLCVRATVRSRYNYLKFAQNLLKQLLPACLT